MIVKPLYGHTSPETAYLISDYPYSWKLRCSIRYWLDTHPKKGVRLCSQTTNPKKSDIWNAPKKSTYNILVGCMYLDEQSHVHWDALNEYTEPQKFLEFLQNFPDLQLDKDQAGRLTYWIAGKIAICKTTIEGKAIISFNNVPQLPSEQDIVKAKENLEIWEKSKSALLTILHKF